MKAFPDNSVAFFDKVLKTWSTFYAPGTMAHGFCEIYKEEEDGREM